MKTISYQTTVDYEDIVTVADCRAFMRVDDAEDDILIAALRDTACLWVENYTNTKLGAVDAIGYLDDWYSSRIGVGPVNSISQVEYMNTAQTWAVLPSANFYYDLVTSSARIFFRDVPSLYSHAVNRVRVSMSIGYNTVPEPLIQAVRILAAHLYENREAAVVGKSVNQLPMSVESLCSAYRVL